MLNTTPREWLDIAYRQIHAAIRHVHDLEDNGRSDKPLALDNLTTALRNLGRATGIPPGGPGKGNTLNRGNRR